MAVNENHRKTGFPIGAKRDEVGALVTTASAERSRLDSLWTVQANRLLEFGFDKELGYPSPQAYLDSLPRFLPKLPEFRDKFGDVPTLIDPRISWQRLLEIVGVPQALVGQPITDWPGNRFTSPDLPYAIYAETRNRDQLRKIIIDDYDNYTKNLGHDELSPEIVEFIRTNVHDTEFAESIPVIRKYLRPDERGATVLEGIYYYLLHPEVLDDKPGDRGNHLLMVGSQELSQPVDGGNVWELRVYLGKHMVFYNYDGRIGLVDNDDSAEDHANSLSRPLIVAR